MGYSGKKSSKTPKAPYLKKKKEKLINWTS